jgi:hypothetical protein
MSETVHIHGLREFRAGLRRMDRTLPKGISKAGKKAAQIVVTAARPRVPVGPESGGHGAASIKPRSTQKGVSVVEGGAKYPYMPWLDFGGRLHPREHQEIVRPRIHRGRYVWAAFGDNRERVMRTYLEALHDVARDAGLNPERF